MKQANRSIIYEGVIIPKCPIFKLIFFYLKFYPYENLHYFHFDFIEFKLFIKNNYL